jgi:hypothetical protein
MTVHQGEQRVVFANANIGTGMELGATLSHDDGACAHQLATKRFDTQHFGL